MPCLHELDLYSLWLFGYLGFEVRNILVFSVILRSFPHAGQNSLLLLEKQGPPMLLHAGFAGNLHHVYGCGRCQGWGKENLYQGRRVSKAQQMLSFEVIVSVAC